MLRLQGLLNKGLEITGSYENVVKVIIDIDKYDGIESFTNSKEVKATVDLDKFDEKYLFDLKNLFFKNVNKFAIKLDSNQIMTQKGDIIEAREFFKFESELDTRKSKIEAGDIVKLRKYSNNGVIYATNGVFLKEKTTDIALVKSVDEKGVASVFVDGKNYKLPTVCCVKVKIFHSSFSKIVSFMESNKKDIKIDGKMLYLKVSEDGKMVEYIAEDRLNRFGGKFWDEELRKKFATKKKIRKVLKPMFDCDDNLMDNAIMLVGSSDMEVQILEGESILEVFNSSKCHYNGTIGSSCMRDKDTDIFQLYVDSSKCAIVKDSDGKIILRSIIWELINKKTGKKIKFLDRVYSSSTSMEVLFISWAKSNNYYSLASNTYSSNEFISPKGIQESITDYYAVTKKAYYKRYPFLDTMRNHAGKTLTCSDGVIQCQSTSGRFDKIG